jgi:hypothetical protein
MIRILCFSIWILFHPVHVTLTSIDYAPENGSFKVFVRMYFDDFLRDYKLTFADIQNTDFSKENASSMVEMERYLGEKIKITVNEKQLKGNLLDLNMVDNEISMNLDFGSVKKPHTVSVKNLIMTGLYSDQTNMIIVKVNKFEEGIKLTAYMTERTFKIN